MGWIEVNFPQKDGTAKKIFNNGDYALINILTSIFINEFHRQGWKEVTENKDDHLEEQYMVDITFGELSKETDDRHVTFDGVPRRHIEKMNIVNFNTGKTEFSYIRGSSFIHEPIIHRNHLGHLTISCS